jgi:nucleoside-diphosphate-sugar epimerase
MSKRVLITGGSGFIGDSLAKSLISLGINVNVITRNNFASTAPGINYFQMDISDPNIQLDESLQGVDTVLHCAGRVHMLKELSSNPLAEYRRVNVDFTLRLAREAARSGVRRFVYLSTLGVHGGSSKNGAPLKETDLFSPQNHYSLSKLEAEEGLWSLSRELGLEVVVIRPPLVYGFEAPGNFYRLFNLIKCGIPLPLGALHNKRSLVSLDNLVDFVYVCMTHPNAAGEAFFVSDGSDLSTTELVKKLIRALDSSSLLLPIPSGLLRFLLTSFGFSRLDQQLCGSLQISILKAATILGWIPPVSVDNGILNTIRPFQSRR